MDFIGTFYGGENWKEPWFEIKKYMDERFEKPFTSNNNSFETCFQFV